MNCSHSAVVRLTGRALSGSTELEFCNAVCSCGAMRLVRSDEGVWWFGWFTPMQIATFGPQWWREAELAGAGA